MLDHISLGCADLDRAEAFYTTTMPVLGCKQIMKIPNAAIAYGREAPTFWLTRPFDGGDPSVGNGLHVAFSAQSRAQVDSFYEAAIAAGAKDEGPPGLRPYSPTYYAAFVRDPDGHKIEVVCHLPA